jgi:hypothetical protein
MFAMEILPTLAGNLDWNVIYGDNAVTLEVVAGLAGDYNDDGSVDAADYVVWRKNDGTPEGYDTWRANFGETATGAGGISTVPEPATLLALAIGFLAAVNSGCGQPFRAGRGRPLHDGKSTVTPPRKIDA